MRLPGLIITFIVRTVGSDGSFFLEPGGFGCGMLVTDSSERESEGEIKIERNQAAGETERRGEREKSMNTDTQMYSVLG